MEETLLLGVLGCAIAVVAVVIGYGVGAGMCRRMVRAELWRMFEAMGESDPVTDNPYTTAAMRWDVIALIKRLEL